MNNIEMEIGEKIKSYRKKREITQEQLADYLKISFQSVSKWECGDAYPDITMLPKIAMFFGITTDELLGIDKLKEQKETDEYNQRLILALGLGDTKKAVAIMREATAKYTGNFKIMQQLASAMRFDAYSVHASSNKEYQQSTWKEIISIGEKIRAECRDDTIRREIIEVMTYGYVYLGEREKAKKLINENLGRIWISQEKMLESILEGDELIKQRQQNLMQFAELCCWEMGHLSENFEPENKVEVLENIIKIYSMIYTDGNYGYYHVWIPYYHIDAMNIYLDLENNAKALENLKSAASHAIAFDNLSANAPYTAPLVNKLINAGLATSQKGNQSYQLLKKLDDEKYNILHDTPEYIEICENLKKHANEDN